MLKVHQLTWHAQRDRKCLLHDVTFAVEPGELVVLLGPNGAGKSTLLRLLAGDLPLQQGSIQWNGAAMQDRDPQELAKSRSVLGQHNAMGLAFTVEEVVRMGRYPYYGNTPAASDLEAVDRAVQTALLDPLRARVLDTTSGGEQQRTHIARAFTQVDNTAPGTRILLLDEPLNDLDIRHQHALMHAARSFAKEGHCVLAVLHDVNMAAQYADRIILMKASRITASGAPDEVLTAPILTEAYGLNAQVMPHPCHSCPLVFFDGSFRKGELESTVDTYPGTRDFSPVNARDLAHQNTHDR
ncbi:MAG: heme ABC transporter ATP-binding protein [Flavobacteriales bacterium]